MDNNGVFVEGIKKTYLINKRESASFRSAVKSMFRRERSEVCALNGIDMSIEAGEVRGLIGPNGAGKSTLIKIVSGVLYPTEGQVNVMGYVPWLQRESYVKHIGVLFGQKSQLWWDLPAIDSFYLCKKFYDVNESTYKHNLEYFIDILSIGDIIAKPVRQLSLGERMKCEFVCALIHDPKLVYLDEPTIGLDMLSKMVIRQFIKDVNREKKTTFIVTTHDLGDIEELCPKITIINRGEKVFDDTADSLRSFFVNRKTVSIKFSEPVADSNILDGFSILSKTDTSAEIEIDLDSADLKSEIYKVFDRLPVQDINISGIGIEKVIEQIYRG